MRTLTSDMGLHADMLLYHGSYCEVKAPDLERCARYKDFGQGFYLTTSKAQAEVFSKISLRKAVSNGIVDADRQYGMVSVFRFEPAEELLTRIYSAADREWLRCIVGHRKGKTFPDTVRQLKKYDVIAGKIANDNTNATITAYMSGVFGEIDTKAAEDICISLLLPERLQNQFCFRTARAVRSLVFVESEQVWQ